MGNCCEYTWEQEDFVSGYVIRVKGCDIEGVSLEIWVGTESGSEEISVSLNAGKYEELIEGLRKAAGE